jgi:predicted nucleic acid-binding protein
MTYLIDANVLSEPTRVAPSPKVIAWLSAIEGDFVVDSIVLGEIYLGILALPAGRKRGRLEQWFEQVAGAVECLPWDAAVSRRWARLVISLRQKGRTMPLLDAMIAATALEHGLTVATRNFRDFQHAGVSLFNPFA